MPASIGPYRVEREIGRGGMGVVYLARDSRLDRAVAIKALPGEFAGDVQRMARFQREARVVASLSHPHLAAVYGLEETPGAGGGGAYIVMEYVDGPTLADRLAVAPIPLDEALAIASQVAGGVEAAHEAGVIHRDLKPANIKLTADGRAKVLDFGLAREVSPLGSRSGVDPLATLSRAPMTNAGAVMGTVGYMAPEQARGRTVDRRADIFAFGCVLFEMLTGKPPFGGATQADVLAAVLEREVDLSALPARTPASVRELLARCLEKDASRRLRDIGDARLVLQEAVDKRLWSVTGTGLPAARPRRSLSRWAVPAGALVVGAGLSAAGLWWAGLLGVGGGEGGGSRVAMSAASASRLAVVFPNWALPREGIQLSPDGRLVAYIGESAEKPGAAPVPVVFVRALDRFEPERLAGTEQVLHLRFSADSRSVLVVTRNADDQGERYVWQVPVDGKTPPTRLLVRPALTSGQGTALDLCGLPGGEVLVVDPAAKEFIRLRAGRDQPVARVPIGLPERTDAISPRHLLPDGRTLVCSGWGYEEGQFLDLIDLYDVDTGKLIKRLTRGMAAQVVGGRIFLLRGRTLLVAPFDLAKLEITADPVPVENDVSAGDGAMFQIGSDGTLGFREPMNRPERRWLGIVDTSGRITPVDATPRNYTNPPMLSRNGKRYGVTIERTDRLFELWSGALDQPMARRAYHVPGSDVFLGAISPTGDRAVVAVYRGETYEVRVIRLDGPGEALALFRQPADVQGIPAGWSANPDKVFLSYGNTRTAGLTRTVLMDISKPIEDINSLPAVLPGGAASEVVMTSPDGRWITYAPVAATLREAFLARWEGDRVVGEPVRIPVGTLAGSVRFMEGNVLVVTLQDGSVVRQPFREEEGGKVSFGPAERVMDRSVIESVNSHGMMASLPDGRFFAALNEERGPVRPVFRVVPNFLAEVEARGGEAGTSGGSDGAAAGTKDGGAG